MYVLTCAHGVIFCEDLQEWLNSQKTGTTATIFRSIYLTCSQDIILLLSNNLKGS
jgi:hypothetical protein